MSEKRKRFSERTIRRYASLVGYDQEEYLRFARREMGVIVVSD